MLGGPWHSQGYGIRRTLGDKHLGSWNRWEEKCGALVCVQVLQHAVFMLRQLQHGDHQPDPRLQGCEEITPAAGTVLTPCHRPKVEMQESPFLLKCPSSALYWKSLILCSLIKEIFLKKLRSLSQRMYWRVNLALRGSKLLIAIDIKEWHIFLIFRIYTTNIPWYQLIPFYDNLWSLGII